VTGTATAPGDPNEVERPEPGPEHPWWRRAGRSWLELFCLSGFAVAQPLLDVYGRAPEVFIFERAEPTDIVLFGLAVVLVPPTVLWAVEQVVALVDRRAGRLAHLGFVALLLALLAVQVLRHLGVPAGAALGAAAVLAAAAGAFAYARYQVVRQWLLFAAFAPLLFLGLFLGTSRVSELLSGQDVAAADVAAEDPRSIVMLIWDEWPLTSLIDADGEIDAELYPNLAALAGDGAWFRNATGVSNGTAFAVPSVLTGRHPPAESTSAIASAYPESIFTMLAGQYDLDVIESYTMMCPPNLCDSTLVDGTDGSEGTDAEAESTTGSGGRGSDPLGTLLSQARSVYRTMITPTEGEGVSALDETTVVADTDVDNLGDAVAVAGAFDDAEAAEQGVIPAIGLESVDQLIDSIEPDEEPTLHFAHMQLPHAPYRFLPSRQEYALPAELEENEMLGWTMGERSGEQAEADFDRQRSMLQMAYVDQLVGDIVQRMEDTGTYDDSVIVMTADHGAGFVPGEVIRGLGLDPDGALDPAVHADLLYVPMIVKGPGFEPGTVRDDNVMTVDVVPTIAELIGLDLPWSVDGISLVSDQRASDEKQYRLATLQMESGGDHVSGDVGAVQRFDGAAVFAEVLARHTGTLLADDNPDFRPYAIGEAGDLVGRDAEGLVEDEGGTGALSVALGEPGAFDDVDLREPLPVFVEGDVEGGEAGETYTLAFSIDGRIAAVTTTYPQLDRPHRFRALLVPGFVVAGANQLEVWRVTGDEGDWRLVPLSID
jgi:hypothetical protein